MMNCISRNIYMYICKRKLSLTHTQTNKQQQQQLRVQSATNNNYSEKR